MQFDYISTLPLELKFEILARLHDKNPELKTEFSVNLDVFVTYFQDAGRLARTNTVWNQAVTSYGNILKSRFKRTKLQTNAINHPCWHLICDYDLTPSFMLRRMEAYLRLGGDPNTKCDNHSYLPEGTYSLFFIFSVLNPYYRITKLLLKYGGNPQDKQNYLKRYNHQLCSNKISTKQGYQADAPIQIALMNNRQHMFDLLAHASFSSSNHLVQKINKNSRTKAKHKKAIRK